ncbi:MAG TPA: ring-cleaving dioxygenase [Gemmatimonadota bacterium]|nr:ring-cleaving dioxygenase [Gemmatimonadota bacterium]
MNHRVHGIHHVTAIAGDPQENLDFYLDVMGLRLVKRSVNQDAPDTYHLFFADGAGTPGTDLTFFPWPRMRAARAGTGMTVEVPLAIPLGGLSYWKPRLAAHGVEPGEIETRFGERSLSFRDPHGLPLALVETDDERRFVPWDRGPVPPEHQIRGIHAVRIRERRLEPTTRLLLEVLGFETVGAEGGRHRYAAGGGSGTIVELEAAPQEPRGAMGTGGVHHVAWRVEDDEEEMALRAGILAAGLHPTPQIDRFWFRSVYFYEPGGALFELATEGPGFDRDEAPENLGERLILPPWMEARRAAIEAALPPLEAPSLPG